MSTHENALPSSLAHLLIELSQDIEKREQFKNNPSLFLGDGDFRPEQIEALLSRDPEMIRLAFSIMDTDPPLAAIRPPAEKKKKVPKKKVPKKKVPKKKVAKKKVPKKKK
jgi:hypothetical protein